MDAKQSPVLNKPLLRGGGLMCAVASFPPHQSHAAYQELNSSQAASSLPQFYPHFTRQPMAFTRAISFFISEKITSASRKHFWVRII